MDFINFRKLQDDKNDFDEMRKQKFIKTKKMTFAIELFGYGIGTSFFLITSLDLMAAETLFLPRPLTKLLLLYHWIVLFAGNILFNIGATFSGVLMMSSYIFLYSLMEYLTNEFKILGRAFENLSIDENEDEIKKLIEHHQELLR